MEPYPPAHNLRLTKSTLYRQLDVSLEIFNKLRLVELGAVETAHPMLGILAATLSGVCDVIGSRSKEASGDRRVRVKGDVQGAQDRKEVGFDVARE